jgi:DNA-binding SARP family transcriptional activator
MQMSKRVSSDAAGFPRLITLGGLTLVSSSPHESVTLLGPGKPVALLIYLHSAPNRSASREHLTDLLWADLDQTAARHALRQTAWYLRQRLGPKCIGAENGDVVLTLDLTCDRDEFVRAVTEGRAADAVTIYQGHFLPDFAVPGGLEFEHWADAERTRLRLMFLRAAESVVRGNLSTGRVREGRALALRIRDGNLQSEAAWRLHLETLVAGHDAMGALADAERLLTMLRQDGRTPEPATRALLRAIQREPEQAAAPATGLVAELVGREREFARIVEAWETTRTGRATHLHLSAPAGLGKTRLLLDVDARLAAATGRCVYVRANPGERAVPFALAAELAAQLVTLEGAMGIAPASAGALVALNPALSSTYRQPADPAVGDEATRRRALAMADLVHTLADEAPLAILIDDLHWADPASRQLLETTRARLEDDPLLVVTAARPVPGTEPPRDAVRLDLPPLTLDQVTALLASLGALPDTLATTLPRLLLDASDGSPLLALESLQAALDVGHLCLADGAWSCPEPAALAERLSHGSAVRDRVAHLERQQGWLLTLLATGGLPIPAGALAAAAGRPPDTVTNDLGELERRGFVQRAIDGWEPAHDAIAEAALASAAPDARRAAAAALAKALLREPAPSPHVIARAVQLLAQSDESALGEVFRHWVRGRRRVGDRRSGATLATDLGIGDPALTARLARSLPLTDRLGFSPAVLGLAAGALLVIAAFVAGTLVRVGAEPDGVLLIGGAADDGTPVAYAVSLFENGWDPAEPIEATAGTPQPRLADAGGWYAGAGTVDGVSWGRSVTSDTGSVDVVVRRRDGGERWLTSGSADDNFEDWSPDGRYILLTTGRWHDRSMYDLAVVEVETGALRQLTRGDDHDFTARWSPDGSRVAFVRRHVITPGPDEVCWVAVDGSSERCRSLDPDTFHSVAWLSPTELAVVFTDQGEQALLRVDLVTGAARAMDIRGADVLPSPDGRWVLCRCLPEGTQRLAWYVSPLDRPERLRLLTWRGLPSTAHRLFWAGGRKPSYLARLEVDSLPAGVAVGSTIRPTVIARDGEGRVTRTPLLMWSVSDTALASVRPDGSIVTRATGTVTLTASAGGWRTASATIRIHADTARVVLRETWTGNLEEEWRPYGDPRPILEGNAAGSGLLVNGDASHFSGVYSRRALSPGEGFGIEVDLSTPVTASQWQHLNVVLASPDTALLTAWDHVSGAAPALDQPERACSMATLPLAGQEHGVTLALLAAGTRSEMVLPWPPGNGRWYTVRIQALPDGRCGFALNGRAIWLSRAHLPMDQPFRIVFTGQTVGTRLLVGPLAAWEGVRTDVDWGEVDKRE